MEKLDKFINMYYFKYKGETPIGDKACKYITRCNMLNLEWLSLSKIVIIQAIQILEMREYSICARESGKTFNGLV
jgi:hypothetical protein